MAPASGPEQTNALWHKLWSVAIARSFATPAGNAWQNLLPPLPQTLGVLVLLLRLRLPMVARGLLAHGKLHIPQSPFLLLSSHYTTYIVCIVLSLFWIC